MQTFNIRWGHIRLTLQLANKIAAAKTLTDRQMFLLHRQTYFCSCNKQKIMTMCMLSGNVSIGECLYTVVCAYLVLYIIYERNGQWDGLYI